MSQMKPFVSSHSSKMECLLVAARDDDDKLAELLESSRRWLENMATAKVGRDLARRVSKSEIAQIVIVASLESFQQFQGQSISQFRCWLRSIFNNRLVDLSRHYVVAKVRSVLREDRLGQDDLESRSERPSQILSKTEDYLQMLRAIESLPEQLRQIVRMRYEEDRSFASIGEELSLGEPTVRRKWHEAIERLRAHMQI